MISSECPIILDGLQNLFVKGVRKILDLGPSCIVAKRGEYGGFMGYLANMADTSVETVKQAIIMGSLMASFNVEDFSINRLKALGYDEIKERYKSFKKCMDFGDITTLA